MREKSIDIHSSFARRFLFCTAMVAYYKYDKLWMKSLCNKMRGTTSINSGFQFGSMVRVGTLLVRVFPDIIPVGLVHLSSNLFDG